MSAKNLDSKGRFRNRTIGFRVSDEENNQINTVVAISGLTKQDYIVKRLLCKDIIVRPNPRIYKALKSHLNSVLIQLQRLSDGCEVSNELLETINLITKTLNEMKEEKEHD